MKKSQFTAEEITKILAEAAPRGASKGVARQYGITERTIYQWRQKFGGLKSSEVKRMRELVQENAKLKRVVANQALDIEGYKEVLSKKW